MPITYETLSAILNHGFDTVIDVRSPAEFSADHIPGAINLPALSNAQRAQVGTIYTQVSAFDARKIGAAMVARNVADHIDTHLHTRDGAWRPLVYCWRGGQRSGSFASILQQIGWRAETVKGGYQSFRRLVHATLYETPLPHRIILLDGNTGTAKTDILARLSARGVQTLDLERLAAHRGSLLGAVAGGQPAQKGFDTRLATALCALDPARVVVVEAESSKIGSINLPEQLWWAMCAAPRILIDAPIAARSAYLATAYADMIADHAELRARLQPLRHIRGHAQVAQWETLLAANDYTALAASLMADHYDPAYAKSRRIAERDVLGTVHAPTLDAAGQEHAADAIMRLVTAPR